MQRHVLTSLIDAGEHHDLLDLAYPKAVQAGSDEYAALLDQFELELWELVRTNEWGSSSSNEWGSSASNDPDD
tara:strand:+ start:255 stop:473 length:219 start_codon:yes stop_codon:yes gene_type:complete